MMTSASAVVAVANYCFATSAIVPIICSASTHRLRWLPKESGHVPPIGWVVRVARRQRLSSSSLTHMTLLSEACGESPSVWTPNIRCTASMPSWHIAGTLCPGVLLLTRCNLSIERTCHACTQIMPPPMLLASTKQEEAATATMAGTPTWISGACTDDQLHDLLSFW